MARRLTKGGQGT
jgi:hypothetical protein